jgi:hypothetical protein
MIWLLVGAFRKMQRKIHSIQPNIALDILHKKPKNGGLTDEQKKENNRVVAHNK